MGHPFRDFLFFTGYERRRTLLLLLLIIGIGFGRYAWLEWMYRPDRAAEDEAAAEYATFLAGLQRRDSLRLKQSQLPELFAFDPNQVDSASLRRLGLPDWMAGNLLRYRRRGGRFRRPEEFRKLYGLTDELYARLLPYIRIDSNRQQPSHPSRNVADSLPRLYQPDSLLQRPLRPEKFANDTLIEVNRADTILLQRIPGIGSGIARLIVEYREKLGGYHHIGQLREIRLNSQLLEPWLSVDTTAIRRLHINQESLRSLQRHPYLSYQQARAIVDYRRRHGPIRHLQALSLLDAFTPADLERLSHYVSLDGE